MIASKIREDSYISYHSAFEYYGVKNQMLHVVYVLSKKRFEDFEFESYSYKFVNSRYNFGIVQITDVESDYNELLEMKLKGYTYADKNILYYYWTSY